MKNVDLLISNGVNLKESFELFGDIETYNETLEDFLSTVSEKLANIKKYKEAGDMPNYAILVHSLKSDSKYLGFVTLADLSYQHEMQSKASNTVYVYEHYDELMTEATRIVNLVREYLGKEPIAVMQNTTAKSDKKILIVDDSNLIRNLIQKFFHDEYEVLTASDGQVALDMIKNAENDLFGMFLDLNMPNANGFVVLDYFQEQGLFSKIPVAIITGEDTVENLNHVACYPIVDILRKPFNENNLRATLTKMGQYHF